MLGLVKMVICFSKVLDGVQRVVFVNGSLINSFQGNKKIGSDNGSNCLIECYRHQFIGW